MFCSCIHDHQLAAKLAQALKRSGSTLVTASTNIIAGLFLVTSCPTRSALPQPCCCNRAVSLPCCWQLYWLMTGHLPTEVPKRP